MAFNNKNRENVNSVIKSVTEAHTPTIPSSIREDTSQARMMGSLEARKMDKTRNRLESCFIRAFQANVIEEDIARLCFNNRWKASDSALLAIESADENLAKTIGDAALSTETFEKIQGMTDYALVTQPLEGRIAASEQIDKSIKARLSGNIKPVFMPLADANTWLRAFEQIAEFKVAKDAKGSTRDAALLKALQQHLPLLTGKVDDALRNVVDVASLLSKSGTLADIISKVANTYEDTILSENIDKENAATTGMFGNNHMWVEIVKSLAGIDRGAMLLCDQRRSQEASVLTACTYSVAPGKNFSGKQVEMESPDGFDDSNFQRAKLSKTLLTAGSEEEIDFIVNRDTGHVDEERTIAGLVVHILNWAGASISFEGITDPSDYSESTFLTLPITEHVLGEVLFDRVTRAWYAFSQSNESQFTFLEALINYARAKRPARLQARIVRAELTKLLTDDIYEFTKEVRALLKEGAAEGLKQAVKKSLTKFSSYEESYVSYFDNRLVTCGTSVKDYASTGSVAFTADKAIAALNVPKASRMGFSESLMVRDPHEFDVVTESASMEGIGKMYNAIVSLSTPTSYSFSVTSSPLAMMGEIYADYYSSILRENPGRPKNVSASEITPESIFSPLDDYFVQVTDFDQLMSVRLPSGFGEVNHKFDTIASVHGVVTHGMFVGSRSEYGSPFSAEMAKTLASSVSDLVDRYTIRPITFTSLSNVSISLKEEDETYVKRLNGLSDEFEDYVVDVPTIRALIAAPSAPSSLVKQFSKQTFISLKRIEFSLRNNVLSVIEKMTFDLYTRLSAAHNKTVVDFVKIMLSRSLTLREQERFNDPIFTSAVKGVLDSIATALDSTDSEMLKVVFLNELMKQIKPNEADVSDDADSLE